jgi:hypothetical protein
MKIIKKNCRFNPLPYKIKYNTKKEQKFKIKKVKSKNKNS